MVDICDVISFAWLFVCVYEEREMMYRVKRGISTGFVAQSKANGLLAAAAVPSTETPHYYDVIF